MTEGSPSAAVHEQYGPLALSRIRQYKVVAVRQLEFHFGEKVAAVEFSSFRLSHNFLLANDLWTDTFQIKVPPAKRIPTRCGLLNTQKGCKIRQGFDLHIRL
jgi:hypothetical protein